MAITPVDRHRLEEEEACLAGWRRFAQATTIQFWRESDPQVRLYGQTAVSTYYYDMAYDLDGRRIEAVGREMMVLANE